MKKSFKCLNYSSIFVGFDYESGVSISGEPDSGLTQTLDSSSH